MPQIRLVDFVISFAILGTFITGLVLLISSISIKKYKFAAHDKMIRERCLKYASKNNTAGSSSGVVLYTAWEYSRFVNYGAMDYYKEEDHHNLTKYHDTANDSIKIDTSEIERLNKKVKKADALILELKTVLKEINSAKVSLELS